MFTVNKHSKVSLQESCFFFTISLKAVSTSYSTKSLEKAKKNTERYIYIVEAFQKYDI